MNLSKIASSVLLVLGINAQANATDLLEIYHAAQSQDAVFASARAAQQAGQEKLTQGRSLLLPSVNLNANTTANDVTTTYGTGSPFTTASGNKQYNSRGYGVTLVQPLFREQNWAAYNEGELQVAISEAQFKLAEDGCHPAQRPDLLRRADRARYREAFCRPEDRHLATTGTGQTQLRGGHGHHHRHP